MNGGRFSIEPPDDYTCRGCDGDTRSCNCDPCVHCGADAGWCDCECTGCGAVLVKGEWCACYADGWKDVHDEGQR